MTQENETRKHPKLVAIQQVSEGWINKYVLTYEKDNGETFTYESVSRKNLEDYTEQLERNAAGCRRSRMRCASTPFCPTTAFCSSASSAIR